MNSVRDCPTIRWPLPDRSGAARPRRPPFARHGVEAGGKTPYPLKLQFRGGVRVRHRRVANVSAIRSEQGGYSQFLHTDVGAEEGGDQWRQADRNGRLDAVVVHQIGNVGCAGVGQRCDTAVIADVLIDNGWLTSPHGIDDSRGVVVRPFHGDAFCRAEGFSFALPGFDMFNTSRWVLIKRYAKQNGEMVTSVIDEIGRMLSEKFETLGEKLAKPLQPLRGTWLGQWALQQGDPQGRDAWLQGSRAR